VLRNKQTTIAISRVCGSLCG